MLVHLCKTANARQSVAVIGAGISGLAAARQLSQLRPDWRVTLFEQSAHFGGHANTVDVTIDGITHGVDTGFLVYNQRTYPALTQLFAELGVTSTLAEMSFSVQLPTQGLEWSGTSLNSVFAQRGNLLRPRFWRMLWDIVRFNRLATDLAQRSVDVAIAQSVRAFLDQHRFSKAFVEGYLLPMIACIWSCGREQMLAFPMATLIRFCHNHGLLQVTQRPQWLSVQGGSKQYVSRMVLGLLDARRNTPVLAVRRADAAQGRGVWVSTAHTREHFNKLIFACHSDQALQLLGDGASAQERRVLGAVRYQPNCAVLHTDVTLLPKRQAAWAAWNCEWTPNLTDDSGVCLHYLINRLQVLPWQQPVIVSLNPVRQPKASTVLASFDFSHPVFDAASLAAQRQLALVQGQHDTWYCGAWTGYGFHEDGLRSGLKAAQSVLAATHDEVADVVHDDRWAGAA